MENAHDMRFIFYHKRNIDEGRDSVYTFVNMLEQAQIDVVDRAVLKHSYEEEDFVDEEMLHLILETLDIHIPIQYTPRCRRTMNAEAYGPTEPGILIDELFEYTIISFLFTMYSLAYDQSEENTIRCMKNFYVIEDLQRRVAAHICAAAQGGPRYDASMTPEERKSFENGIWLCQSCSKLIDTDITRYPKELLQSWKQLAEQTAILEVETTSSTPAFEKDKELVQFYLECFDRPAFQDDIYQEGRMEDFDKAIEDTLIALNTGVLRTRDGSILKQADGKSSVQNSLWREKLYTITDMLTAIRRRLKIAKKEKAYSTYGTGEDVAYCFYDRELAEWLNSTREEILKILSSICKEAGLRELHFRKHRYRW